MPNNYSYEIVQSKNGLPTLVVNVEDKSIPFHSKIDPSRENFLFNDNLKNEKYDLLIILGTGLGYNLTPLIQYKDNYKLAVIIEPLNIADQLLSNTEIYRLIEEKKIIVLCNMNDVEIINYLTELFKNKELSKINFFEHPTAMRIFSEYFNKLKTEIINLINNFIGNKATINQFNNLFLNNGLKHLLNIDQYSYYTDYNFFKEYPALVVSSAPSMENDIPLIQKYQSNFFIIAVDSAVRPLAKFNIKPDFIISIDPQPYIKEHITGYITDSIIITSPVSSIWQDYHSSAVILSLNSHPVSQLLDELTNEKLNNFNSATGNVGTDAVFFALKNKFKSIAFTGIDFSFDRYNIYSRETIYEHRFTNIFNNRKITSEELNFRYIKKSKKLLFEKKRTRNSFLEYKNKFEKLLTQYKDIQLYNTGKYGLEIDGSQKMELQNYINNFANTKIDKFTTLKKFCREISPVTSLFNKSSINFSLNNTEVINNLLTYSQIADKDKERFMNKILRLFNNKCV